MAKAAEILDLVDTPKNTIVLTDLGRRFVSGDVNVRKKIIQAQLSHLKLIQILMGKLEGSPEYTMPYDDCIQLVQESVPNENSAEVLETLIQWGRFGELFGYNDNKKAVYLDRGQ
jgi:NitT/TauT family transport system ATP-binding protein